MPRRNRDNIVLAVPKGRVLEPLSVRLEKAGISTEALTAKSRKLVREDKEAGLSYLLLKPDDVPT
jgi:ATP phosphoribosyltransferase